MSVAGGARASLRWTGRLASLLLLLSLSGILDPVASAAAGCAECCCPGGAPVCPMQAGDCSFRSGCGQRQEAPPAPLTLFSPPAAAVPLVLASDEYHPPPPPASPDPSPVAVPDPPPRG